MCPIVPIVVQNIRLVDFRKAELEAAKIGHYNFMIIYQVVNGFFINITL
jgi:hypothetical protein